MWTPRGTSMFPSARPPARSTTDGQDVRLVANLALDAAASLAAGDHVDQRRQTSAGGRQDAAGDEGLASRLWSPEPHFSKPFVPFLLIPMYQLRLGSHTEPK
jgi:hypothetical protein